MKLRRLRSTTSVKGKRVLIRIDANVPISKGMAVDGPHGRIARSAVDINWLAQRGAKVIVMTHLGRPNGRRLATYSVKPIARRLSGLLGTRIRTARSIVGKEVPSLIKKMEEGEVLLLENVRFDAREEKNDEAFAKELSELGDLYVNDAFAVSHRNHASISAITACLPSYAGPLLAQEVSVLSKLDDQVKEPFVLLLGGLKMSSKLPVIERFIPRIQHLLIGGALANVFLAAQGISIGRSVVESESIELAKKLLKKHGKKIILPVDAVVAKSLRKDARFKVSSLADIKETDRIVDIGPKTRELFQEILADAKTIVWNGPLGFCEIPQFCEGTKSVATYIGEKTGKSTTIVGGGDTIAVIESLRLADKYTLLSTGGGAMLKFLANEPLPGIEVLRKDG